MATGRGVTALLTQSARPVALLAGAVHSPAQRRAVAKWKVPLGARRAVVVPPRFRNVLPRAHGEEDALVAAVVWFSVVPVHAAGQAAPKVGEAVGAVVTQVHAVFLRGEARMRRGAVVDLAHGSGAVGVEVATALVWKRSVPTMSPSARGSACHRPCRSAGSSRTSLRSPWQKSSVIGNPVWSGCPCAATNGHARHCSHRSFDGLQWCGDPYVS